jgi:hypothetical protein
MPDGHVDNFLIPCFCRKLFEDNHPSKSRRHYFFSYIGVCNFLLFFHMCLLVILHFLFTWFAVFLALPFNGRKAFCYYQLKCKRALSALHFLVLLARVKGNVLISLTEYVFSWFIKCSVQFFYIHCCPYSCCFVHLTFAVIFSNMPFGSLVFVCG